MAARSLGTIAAGIARKTGGQVPMGEIYDAIADANKEIHNKYEWPWTRAEAKFPIQAPYETGTVTIANGSTALVGNGTTWNTTWLYKKLMLGGIAYPVAAFLSPTTATLVQAINVTANYVAAPYKIFQDTYPLPDDCEYGTILLVVNPRLGYRLRSLPVYTSEMLYNWPPALFTNVLQAVADAGLDSTTGKALLKFLPQPGSVAEYNMIYRRRPPALSTLSSTTMLPESFDRVIELLAEYMVRFHRPNPMPGWMEVKQEAFQQLQNMRRKMAIKLDDNYAMYRDYPYYENSSIFAGGAFIGVTSAGP
jgi:hypothetical protein